MSDFGSEIVVISSTCGFVMPVRASVNELSESEPSSKFFADSVA